MMSGHHHTEVCTMLGVSAATLRRLAKGYEVAFGELPTDGAGGRVYPDHALDQMQDAREMVKSRRVGTLEQAFKLLAEGEPSSVALPQQEGSPVLLQELASEIKSVKHMLERLSAANAALHARIEALPAPQEDVEALKRHNAYLEGELKRQDKQPPPRRPWWRVWEATRG